MLSVGSPLFVTPFHATIALALNMLLRCLMSFVILIFPSYARLNSSGYTQAVVAATPEKTFIQENVNV